MDSAKEFIWTQNENGGLSPRFGDNSSKLGAIEREDCGGGWAFLLSVVVSHMVSLFCSVPGVAAAALCPPVSLFPFPLNIIEPLIFDGLVTT